MNTTTRPDPGARPEAEPTGPDDRSAPELAIDPARLAHLFRHTVRTGGVNPLLHLMPRFRRAGRP